MHALIAAAVASAVTRSSRHRPRTSGATSTSRNIIVASLPGVQPRCGCTHGKSHDTFVNRRDSSNCSHLRIDNVT